MNMITIIFEAIYGHYIEATVPGMTSQGAKL